MVVRFSYLVDILNPIQRHINWQYLLQQLHNNQRKIIYKYVTFLKYVSAYSGHLQGDD